MGLAGSVADLRDGVQFRLEPLRDRLRHPHRSPRTRRLSGIFSMVVVVAAVSVSLALTGQMQTEGAPAPAGEGTPRAPARQLVPLGRLDSAPASEADASTASPALPPPVPAPAPPAR